MTKEKNRVSFSIYIDTKNNYELTAYIINGEISEICRRIYNSDSDCSETIFKKKDELFDWFLDKFLENIFDGDKEYYDKFLQELNRKFLNKYFRKSYVPL